MADGSFGGRVLALGLLAISGLLSYQAWGNSKLTTQTMDLAKDHACDMDSSCIVLDERARVGKANVVNHRYEYNTTLGMMTVTCQRKLLLFGEWVCSPEEGRMVSKPFD